MENPTDDELRRYEKLKRLGQIIELTKTDFKTIGTDKAARAQFIKDFKEQGGVVKAEPVIARPGTPKKKGTDVK